MGVRVAARAGKEEAEVSHGWGVAAPPATAEDRCGV